MFKIIYLGHIINDMNNKIISFHQSIPRQHQPPKLTDLQLYNALCLLEDSMGNISTSLSDVQRNFNRINSICLGKLNLLDYMRVFNVDNPILKLKTLGNSGYYAIRLTDAFIQEVLYSKSTIIEPNLWNEAKLIVGKIEPLYNIDRPEDAWARLTAQLKKETEEFTPEERAIIMQYLHIPQRQYPEGYYSVDMRELSYVAKDKTRVDKINERITRIAMYSKALKNDIEAQKFISEIKPLLRSMSNEDEESDRIALEVVWRIRESKLDIKYWTLLKDPLMLLRYDKFIEFYESIRNPDLKLPPNELKENFIKSMGKRIIYRAIEHKEADSQRDTILTSTYAKKFPDRREAKEAIDQLIHKNGVTRVLLSSVFRADLPGDPLRASGDHPYSLCTSISAYEGFALGIARGYAYDNALKNYSEAVLEEMKIAVYEIEVPNYYLINYQDNAIINSAADRNAPLVDIIPRYYRDPETNKAIEYAVTDSEIEWLVLGSLPPENYTIKKITLHPVINEDGVPYSRPWTEGEHQRESRLATKDPKVLYISHHK